MHRSILDPWRQSVTIKYFFAVRCNSNYAINNRLQAWRALMNTRFNASSGWYCSWFENTVFDINSIIWKHCIQYQCSNWSRAKYNTSRLVTLLKVTFRYVKLVKSSSPIIGNLVVGVLELLKSVNMIWRVSLCPVLRVQIRVLIRLWQSIS